MVRGIDIHITLDSTGSMSSVLGLAKRKIGDLLVNLLSKFNNLRVSICVHNDYDHGHDIYQLHDFTNDVSKLVQFIKSSRSTSGGDWPECYELVLKNAQSLSWDNDAAKIMIMIGDSIPNSKDKYAKMGLKFIDWKQEVTILQAMNISIYAIQALFNGNYQSEPYMFYDQISQQTNGIHLFLDQFSQVIDMLEMICLNAMDEQIGGHLLDQYKEESKMTNHSLLRAYNDLKRQPQDECINEVLQPIALIVPKVARISVISLDQQDMALLIDCPPAKFQVLDVTVNIRVDEFVTENDIKFHPGFGFYEYTKPEIIADDKLIILYNKITGQFFEGGHVRNVLKIKSQSKTRQKPLIDDTFTAFIQSASYNRKLLTGTKFLYLSSDWIGPALSIPSFIFGAPEIVEAAEVIDTIVQQAIDVIDEMVDTTVIKAIKVDEMIDAIKVIDIDWKTKGSIDTASFKQPSDFSEVFVDLQQCVEYTLGAIIVAKQQNINLSSYSDIKESLQAIIDNIVIENIVVEIVVEEKMTVYHGNGNLWYIGGFNNGKYHGNGQEYHINGKLYYDGEWNIGQFNGQGKEYHNNGKLRYDGQWKDNMKNGYGKKYYTNGKPQYDGQFKNGRFINGITY